MLVSGPTGGVIASRHVAGLTGIDHWSRSTWAAPRPTSPPIIGGKEAFTTAFEIEWGVPIQIPMIDIRTIGAGGGSIAWIDKGGMLRVGPQSAGATPGPACYGQGGTEATVTDANLVLGRLNPGYFLGGRMRLDAEAAQRGGGGRGRAARPATVPETALAIVRIADNNMVGALRSVLIERGLDPRDFTLCAFGGAGPLHAAALMREMGIPRAIVPNHPGQFSAYGFILTDARVDRQRTTQLTSQPLRPGPGAGDHGDAGRGGRGRARRRRATAAGSRSMRGLEMRYLGQNYELELPVTADALADRCRPSSSGRRSTPRTRPASALRSPARSSRSSTTR